jgi:hypothetical protein
LQAFEADASLLDGGHNLKKVFQGATQPVKLPHGQHVPYPQIVQCLSQAGAFYRSAAGSVSKDTAAPSLGERIPLKV